MLPGDVWDDKWPVSAAGGIVCPHPDAVQLTVINAKTMNPDLSCRLMNLLT
jgi:hypothetical protein